jgi:signal transduction histidine kinase
VITDGANAYRMEYRRRDGTTFVGDTVGDAIYNEAGQIISLLGVIRDVTTEAQHQADLESSNRQLEISPETLDHFAYIASHDLRTPLRGIMHVVFFLEADTPPELLPAIQPRLTQLRERTLWMDQMLEGLLQFARKGHLSIDREDTDLSTVLDSIETTIRMGETSKSSLVLERDFSQLPGTSVRTNPVALHHILSNLISNALTHHDGDTAKVVVDCDVSPEGTRIRVTDDGPGIAPRQ